MEGFLCGNDTVAVRPGAFICGNMAIVLRGVDVQLHRVVAIKVLVPQQSLI
jgi:hypothetical protein